MPSKHRGWTRWLGLRQAAALPCARHAAHAAGDATAGCTAMAGPVMRRLLGWLDPKQFPVFVLLPAGAYVRLAGAWHLPAAEAQP